MSKKEIIIESKSIYMVEFTVPEEKEEEFSTYTEKETLNYLANDRNKKVSLVDMEEIAIIEGGD